MKKNIIVKTPHILVLILKDARGRYLRFDFIGEHLPQDKSDCGEDHHSCAHGCSPRIFSFQTATNPKTQTLLKGQGDIRQNSWCNSQTSLLRRFHIIEEINIKD